MARKKNQKPTGIDTLLTEKRKFSASKDYVKFWENLASELVWKKKWHQGLSWKAPDAKWFVGGKLNITESCLDRHIDEGRRNKAALLWEGEPGDRRTLTYYELYRQVNKFANVLRQLGIKKGDRVAIYLPMIPELVISTLACARIGAIHSVVFGGFSPESLRDRIVDLEAKLLITADGGYRRGQIIPLKHDADVALNDCPSITDVVIVKRGDFLLRGPLVSSSDAGGRCVLSPGLCRQRTSFVHSLYFRNHRQTERNRTYHWRLSDRCICNYQICL